MCRRVFSTPCQEVGLQLREDDCWRAYRGSLDAAAALHEALLPGWFPGMSQNIHSRYWFAWVQNSEGSHFSATEADPARAWLIAVLRAVEAGR